MENTEDKQNDFTRINDDSSASSDDDFDGKEDANPVLD